jgi:amino acid transporter
LGIVLLLFHNSWMTLLDSATTLFCWLILGLGVLNLFFTDDMAKMVKRIRKSKSLGTTALVILLVIGLCFVYAGFTQ